MHEQDIRRLADMTTAFYAAQSQSFSDTRQSPWQGWEQLVEQLGEVANTHDDRLKLLDVACGNLRFEQFLSGRFPKVDFVFDALDNCPALMRDGFAIDVQFSQVDIIDCLLRGKSFAPQSSYDVVVAFGLLHHIPTLQLRCELLSQMAELVHPRGILAVSFWQFALDPQLGEKAHLAHESALAEDCRLSEIEFEEGDYLLGWQGKPGVHRFCHSFSEEELDRVTGQITDALPDMQLVSRFKADGRTGQMNSYLVWRRI